MSNYYKSILSPKKILYKGVSIFSFWDNQSQFPKKSNILSFAKLKNARIGKFSRIGKGVTVLNASIGNFTAIGKNSNIGTGSHPTNYLSTNNIFYKKGEWGFNNEWAGNIQFEKPKNIIIGNDVWIGINTIVLDGVEIGDGAIIGAGSIVTKNVPPYAIAVGTPAKIVKYRFPNDIVEYLLKVKWWNLNEKQISTVLKIFHKESITLELLKETFEKINQ